MENGCRNISILVSKPFFQNPSRMEWSGLEPKVVIHVNLLHVNVRNGQCDT